MRDDFVAVQYDCCYYKLVLLHSLITIRELSPSWEDPVPATACLSVSDQSDTLVRDADHPLRYSAGMTV